MTVRFILLCLVWSAQPDTLADSSDDSSARLALVVNLADPLSKITADYYQVKRGIPPGNIIHVDFNVTGDVLDRRRFQKIYEQVLAATPERVQFYALAWSRPYRVDCMSITSAFALGFDEKYCARGCKATAESPYFNSESELPYRDHGLRPSMLLAGTTFEQVKSLIDRGLRSDNSHPYGTAYLLSTSDTARNIRSLYYPNIIRVLADRIDIEEIHADKITGKQDVLFYFTGKIQVKDIASNRFADGAIADHLTSTGGKLFGDKQMSILRWLEAGATASYGTVVEPCSFPQKFPHPGIVIDRYTRGETLIESYWKSVAWPGQGVFVGEPLATPYLGALKYPHVDRTEIR